MKKVGVHLLCSFSSTDWELLWERRSLALGKPFIRMTKQPQDIVFRNFDIEAPGRYLRAYTKVNKKQQSFHARLF